MHLNKLVCLFIAVLCGVAQAQDRAKPNVIFILADDLGWTDLACYGSGYYETPNIDKLAAQGMRFTNGYSCAPNCAPTRAALMTGQYQPRTGVYTVGGIDRFDWESRPLRPIDNVQNLPKEKVTIADSMKRAGYATAMFGKWHLGSSAEYHPSKRGFDEALVTSGKHFNFELDPPVEYPKGQYLADFLTDRAVEFITKNKDKPFFLYLPHFGVHAPHQAKPELIAKFKDKPSAGGHHDPTYAAMIYSVDESVGRIMATLEELGLSKDTLIVFSSDNGGVGGYISSGVSNNKGITDNAPLRGGKGMLYEGGVRVPYIFRWPGKIAAGSVCDDPILSVDMHPTLIALAGGKPPENQPLDGVDLNKALTSNDRKALERDIFWHFPGYLGAGENQWRTLPGGAIRHGDFKLIEFFEDGRLELYNLKDDPSQKNNLTKDLPGLTNSLHARLVEWRAATSAKMPTPNTLTQAERDKALKKKKAKNSGKAGED